MRTPVKILLSTLLLAPFLQFLGGCSCGFDCSGSGNSNDNNPAILTLGFSDSLPEELKEVVKRMFELL